MNLETLNGCPLCGIDRIRILDANVNIYECEPCGYIFDNPRPTVEELIAFYSQPSKYDSWLAESEARDQLWKRRLDQLLRVRKTGSLLDVGAGIGQFLHLARPHFIEVAGTEVSKSAIDIAGEKYGLNLIQGEIGEVDFGGKQFDNITLFHVLEHVPNPRIVVEQCARLLRERGILVIAVPNDVQSLRVMVKKTLGSIGVRKFRKNGVLCLPKIVLDGSIPEIHLSHFTPGVLKQLVERSGFSIELNALDPYYVATGLSRWKQDRYYDCCLALNSVFGKNLYDTILLVARKI